jgi:chromosome segregation ATPase
MRIWNRGKVGMLSLVIAATMVGGLTCGGGLSYKVDDSAMDAVPSADRQAVFDARRDVEIAQGERRTADNQLADLERERNIADKEKQQAQLEIEKATAEQEAAVAARDENRHAAANHGKDAADLGMKACDAKMEWLSQKKDWLKQTRAAADAHVAAAEARVEFEKAKVAKQKGIKPSDDFDVDKFESQWKSKNSDWESARKDAESEQKSAKKLEGKWHDVESQHAKSKGG